MVVYLCDQNYVVEQLLDRRTLKTVTEVTVFYDLSASLAPDTIKNGHSMPVFNVHGSKLLNISETLSGVYSLGILLRR